MRNFFNTKSLHPELTANVSKHNNIAVFATICGTIFIVQDLYVLAPNSVLLAWVVCQVAISLLRLILGHKVYKCTEQDARWSRLTWFFIISISLSGVSMGFAAVIADMYGTVEQQLFVFAVLIGFTGGAVATLSPVIQSCIAYLVGIMVPQIIVLFIQFGDSDMFGSRALETLMGYLGLLYLIIITRASTILYSTFYETILLKNELSEAKEQAETANQAKSKFLSSVSHELRTPLHAIMGSTQLLDMPDQSEEQKSEYRGLISQAGEHLLILIDQILEFSKIEAGKIRLEITEVSLNKLLEECEGLMQPMAAKNNISLAFAKPDSNRVFLSDHLRLKQILLNLVSNAIKYNRPGGEVTVKVDESGKNDLRISVTDTGYGIPEDKQAEVFVAFNRLGRESGEQEGTGIGLVICRELTILLGGSLEFRSQENKGSEFWIDLDTGYFKDEDRASGQN